MRILKTLFLWVSKRHCFGHLIITIPWTCISKYFWTLQLWLEVTAFWALYGSNDSILLVVYGCRSSVYVLCLHRTLLIWTLTIKVVVIWVNTLPNILNVSDHLNLKVDIISGSKTEAIYRIWLWINIDAFRSIMMLLSWHS